MTADCEPTPGRQHRSHPPRSRARSVALVPVEVHLRRSRLAAPPRSDERAERAKAGRSPRRGRRRCRVASTVPAAIAYIPVTPPAKGASRTYRPRLPTAPPNAWHPRHSRAPQERSSGQGQPSRAPARSPIRPPLALRGPPAENFFDAGWFQLEGGASAHCKGFRKGLRRGLRKDRSRMIPLHAEIDRRPDTGGGDLTRPVGAPVPRIPP